MRHDAVLGGLYKPDSLAAALGFTGERHLQGWTQDGQVFHRGGQGLGRGLVRRSGGWCGGEGEVSEGNKRKSEKKIFYSKMFNVCRVLVLRQIMAVFSISNIYSWVTGLTVSIKLCLLSMSRKYRYPCSGLVMVEYDDHCSLVRVTEQKS